MCQTAAAMDARMNHCRVRQASPVSLADDTARFLLAVRCFQSICAKRDRLHDVLQAIC